MFADFSGNGAFLRFPIMVEEHLHDFRSWFVEKMVDVPEPAFFPAEVTLYSLFEVCLGGAHISV